MAIKCNGVDIRATLRVFSGDGPARQWPAERRELLMFVGPMWIFIKIWNSAVELRSPERQSTEKLNKETTNIRTANKEN